MSAEIIFMPEPARSQTTAYCPSVLIVIVAFNHKEDTLACLASLATQTYSNLSVLVVDNGSKDGTSQDVRQQFPTVSVIECKENLGWAGGNNAGITVALENQHDIVCLLNNDTVVSSNAIEELVNAAAELGPSLIHPTIYYYDQPEELQLGPSQGVGPHQPLRSGGIAANLRFAYGACLMVHLDVIRCVGFLDERFFLQLEETDFYRRAEKQGFKAYCISRASILHKESRTFGARRSPLKTYYSTRNAFLLAEKHSCTLKSFWRTAKSVYWSVSNASGQATQSRWRQVLAWLWPSDPYLIAAHAGVRDYIFRRFGRARSI